MLCTSIAFSQPDSIDFRISPYNNIEEISLFCVDFDFFNEDLGTLSPEYFNVLALFDSSMSKTTCKFLLRKREHFDALIHPTAPFSTSRLAGKIDLKSTLLNTTALLIVRTKDDPFVYIINLTREGHVFFNGYPAFFPKRVYDYFRFKCGNCR